MGSNPGYIFCLNFKLDTGKSFSETLIIASTNPQYDKRLFIDLPVQYMKTRRKEHVFVEKFFWMGKQKNKKERKLMYTTFSELVVLMYWTGKPMSNLLSYCGLVDARIRASIKDLPVLI